MPDPDRHLPLPPLTRLPAHIWRSLSLAARAIVLITGAAILVTTVLLAPRIGDTRRRNAAQERREEAAAEAKRVRGLRELQRPRRARSPHGEDPGSGAAARRRRRRLLLEDLAHAVSADARQRGSAPAILRTECEPPPGARPPARDLRHRRARLACVAVTSDVRRSRVSAGATIGFPYRAVADFRSGRLTWCRVAGQAAEGAFTRRRRVNLSRACGG